MAYLPVNPCCTDVVSNTPCGCSSTTSNNPCATGVHYSKSITYNGPILPCSNVQPCDDLNIALSKIDAIICTLVNQQAINTSEIATIKQQVISINQTLTTCCDS
tara:strand:+ start:5904 stop:6215 length:312 start_codon:yes stop_codon:yes gene_type:complete